MGATFSAIGSYFSSAAAGAGAAGGAAAGTAAAAGAAAAGTAAAGSGIGTSLLTAGLTAAAGSVVSSMLAPGRPDLPAPVAMPDPLAQEQARKRSLIEQISRGGRASTILTDLGGSGKLGG